MNRESYRRSLREKGPLSFKTRPARKRADEILRVAHSPVVTMASTTPIYDGVKIMAGQGFRRIPIANPGTKRLEGIVTATDIVDYLGGGKKYEIIEKKFAGNIFKAANEPIRTIMTRNVISVETSSKISDAIKLMRQHNLGGLPVVDNQKRVRAIITERDVTNLFSDILTGVKVKQIMSKTVITALPKTTIFEAAKTMINHGFRRLPIVLEKKVTGIATTMDIVRFFGSGKAFQHLESSSLNQVLNTPIQEIATRDVFTVEPDADVGEAAKRMENKNIGALPVVKAEKLVGIITERDFFKIIE